MKTNLLYTIAIVLLISINVNSANKISKDTTVCFLVKMDCESCKQKIEKNIAFEKGVKALDVNLKSNMVTVKYNKYKNSPQQLKSAIEHLKYKVEIIEK